MFRIKRASIGQVFVKAFFSSLIATLTAIVLFAVAPDLPSTIGIYRNKDTFLALIFLGSLLISVLMYRGGFFASMATAFFNALFITILVAIVWGLPSASSALLMFLFVGAVTFFGGFVGTFVFAPSGR